MYTEHMVDNPLYSDTGSIHESYRDRNLSIAANPQYGTRAEVTHTTYETISEFPPRLKGIANTIKFNAIQYHTSTFSQGQISRN